MIKTLTSKDLPISAKIHFEGMSNDFLPRFGIKFLEILHKQLIIQPEVICLGNYEKNKWDMICAGSSCDLLPPRCNSFK